MKQNKKEYDINPITYLIWVKRIKKNEFFTEAHTLNEYNNIWPRNKCPHCETAFKNEDKISEDDVSWIFECPGCKVHLEIYRE